MSDWLNLCVPNDITKILTDCGFHEPTPIQRCVIPTAIRDRSDVLGAAPTGSGKTLSFGIPLIVRISEIKRSEAQSSKEHHEMDLTEEGDASDNLCSDDMAIPLPSIQKHTMKKKKKKIDDVYQNLAFIEELDADTGNVLNFHCLLNDEDAPSTQVTKCSRHRVKEESSTKLENKPSTGGRIHGLVLVPTRELAMQIYRHLRLITDNMESPIRVEAIVGGMSIQKQKRLLSSIPDILVATPGRLWHLIQEGNQQVCSLQRAVDILVVDEADRLVEANHFDDLRKLFTWLDNTSTNVTSETGHDEEAHQTDAPAPMRKRQTLVFSATLTFVHRGTVRPGAKRFKQRSDDDHMTKELKLGALRRLLGLSSRAKVFDLSSTPPPAVLASINSATSTTSTTGKVAALGLAAPEGLQEFRLSCPNQPSKDIHLFWFLAFARHHRLDADSGSTSSILPAGHNVRTLVFLNSKSGVRRLAGVMRLLADTNAFSVSRRAVSQRISVLHADMPQKQRLRALEQFQADPCGILLASDVASRGLDLAMETTVPGGEAGVTWVIHFEVPHTAELYVHRRGRTARANQSGTSVLLLSPNEVLQWRRIITNLVRCSQIPVNTSSLDLAELPINPSQYESMACERIVALAKQLDLAEHSAARKKANDNWFSRAAEEADILLESDSDESVRDRKGAMESVGGNISQQQEFVALRSQLRRMVFDCTRSLLTKPAGQHVAPSKKVVSSMRKQLKRLKSSKKPNGSQEQNEQRDGDCVTQLVPVDV